ncbi:MAG: N-acetylneuraminate synthase family protein [Nitrospirae bacterium]|nr:N-acetylneuraminate synthase family protein [Nitrospirota bacterium]
MTGATRVTVIAEVAQGFEGDPSLAVMFVRAAAAGEADLVKFQLVYADELATPDYLHYELFQRLEMSDAEWERVAAEARRAHVGLAFDVYGQQSLRVALKCGADAVKLHATDFFNAPLVEAVLGQAPRVFLSAGGITVEEVAAFLRPLEPSTLSKLTLLYGFQAEPTAVSQNYLARLATLRMRFPALQLGFMDHAEGDSDEAGWLGVLALPFGVTAIEKHLTLDRSLMLEDYVSALSPRDFARYVARLRAAGAALGSGDLELTPPECVYRSKALKTVVAARSLTSGATIQSGDVVLLRAPLAEGREPLHRLPEVVDRRITRDVNRGQPVYREDLA